MKKLLVGFLTIGIGLGIVGCGTSEETTTKSSSSVEQSIEDSSSKEAEKMKKIEEKLSKEDVEVRTFGEDVVLTREKGIDYDYFEMTLGFSDNGEILNNVLELKGNIDGEKKDSLFYKVKSGRMVESQGSNTDITALSEVLQSIDISDKELVKFGEWYYQENNK